MPRQSELEGRFDAEENNIDGIGKGRVQKKNYRVATLRPGWPESPESAVIQRGRRKGVKREPIAAINGLNICYTGWRLDQGDLDALAHALHLASHQLTGQYVQFTAKGFLKGIGRSHGKSGRETAQGLAQAIDSLCRGDSP